MCYHDKTFNKGVVPFIAHIKINESLSHFVVVYEINKKRVCLMDPAIGYRKINYNNFILISTGYYITFKPKSNLINIKQTDNIKNIINKILIDNKKKIYLVLFFNIIYTILSIIMSFYISFLKSYRILIILLFSFNNFLLIFLNYYINKISNKLLIDSSNCFINYFYKHLFNLPLKYIHIKEKGELLKRANDANIYIENKIKIEFNKLFNIFMYFSTLIIIFLINKKITLYILIIDIVYLLLITCLYRKSSYYLNDVLNSEEDYENHLIEDMNLLDTIYHNHANEYFKDKLFLKYTNLNQTKWQLFKIENLITTINKLINPVVLFLLITFTMQNGKMYELLIILYFLVTILNDALLNIASIIPSTLYLKKIYNKLNDYFYLKENINIPRYNHLIIKNMTFSYDANINIINNFNLKLLKGEKIVIKGLSGCGKSTLAKIICGDIDKYQGYMKSPSKVIYISQDEHIFSDTFRNNVCLGTKCSDNYINDVFKLVCAEYLLNSVHGLDSFIFGGGVELSGGEKQKVILVRALLKNPNLLIMDEALSQVSKDEELIIFNNILKHYPHLSLIYISHSNLKYPVKTLYM